MFSPIKSLYDKIIFANRMLKIARLAHFSKINPQHFSLNENDRCLLLAPHSDDETIGCGGVLAIYPENFEVVCLTDGRHGGEQERENLVEIRKKEFKEAMSFLNIKKTSFFDIEDRKLIQNFEIFQKLDINKFDYVFIPNYFDEHKDHKAVTVLLQKLLRKTKCKPTLKIVFYEVWSSLPIINHYLNISDIIEKKKEAISLYKSQTRYVDFVGGICSLNAYRGMLTNCKYAEAYGMIDIETFLKL